MEAIHFFGRYLVLLLLDSYLPARMSGFHKKLISVCCGYLIFFRYYCFKIKIIKNATFDMKFQNEKKLFKIYIRDRTAQI